MTECYEDIAAWRPKSYATHFQKYALRWSDHVVAEYGHLDTEWKEPFEHTLAVLDEFLAQVIPLLGTVVREKHFERDPTLSLLTVTTAQGTLGQFNHIIAGGHTYISEEADPFDVTNAQAMADSLF